MKDGLRKSLLLARDAMASEKRACASRRIVQDLLKLEEYRQASGVMSYMPIGSEVDVEEFNRRVLADGKALYLPVALSGGRMYASRLRNWERMREGRFSVREPEFDEIPENNEIHLIVIPGLAFDRVGGRIGYGAGYYDRFLPNLKARRVGVCFTEQLVERVWMKAHDVPMDLIITEDGAYRPAG